MKKIDIIIITFIVIFSALLYSYGYDKGISLHDEGRDMSAFVKVLNGKMAYRDFRWVHGPLALYFHSLIFKLRGINILYIRQCLILIALLVSILSYLLARFLLPRTYSAIAAFLAIGFYGFPQYTSNHMYGTLCGLIALMFILRFILFERKLSYIVASGILTGFIFGFMQAMGGFVFAAIFTYILLSQRDLKLLFVYTVFTAITVLMIYLYFIINVPWNLLYENLNPHWRLTLMQALGTFPSPFIIFQKGFSNQTFNLWRNAVLFWLPPLLIFIVMILLLFRFKKGSFNSKAENKVLLLFAIYQTFMLIKLFIDKGVEGVVFYTQVGIILSVYISCLIIIFFKQRFPRISIAVRFLIFTSLILLYFIEITPFTIAHFYGFKNDYKLPFKRAPVYVNYKIGRSITDTVDYIKSNTSLKDKVIFAVYSPMFNFLTERENPLYDNELSPGVFRDNEMEEKAIETIKLNRVKYFIFVELTQTPGQSEGWGPYIFGKDYAVSFSEFIKDNYHIEKEFGSAEFPPTSLKTVIYRRNYE